MKIDHQKEEIENQAVRIFAEAQKFISGHPGLNGTDRSGTIFLQAQDLRKRLNDTGNKLLAAGGRITQVFGEISDLIRNLDIAIDNRGYYMESRILWTQDSDYVRRISNKINLQIHDILATETRFCEGRLCNSDTGVNVQGIQMKLERIRKIYHALLVQFSLNGQLSAPWKKISERNGHLGWMAVNLTKTTLHSEMDPGHAFGRIWDFTEADLAARRSVTQTDAQESEWLSYTLISNVSNAQGFTPYQLELKPDFVPEGLNMEMLLKQTGRLVTAGIRANSCKQSESVIGGREDLVPLKGIFLR